jgi:catechol 2,3-dioxygenase-like lactoylglutathione lyase family enzyme
MSISLASSDRYEEQARAQLQRLLRRYDLRKWQLTDTVIIDRLAIPHSMPVLTLNTRYLDDDERALAVYLHEQLHWYAPGWRPEVTAALAELRERYPSVPSFESGGARSGQSTYLHLVVCALEYASLAEVIGSDAARTTLERADVYAWIYKRVLGDWDYLAGVLASQGLPLNDARLARPAGSRPFTAPLAGSGKEPGVIAVAGGVQLYVLDVRASAGFYVRGLGFRVDYARRRDGRPVDPFWETFEAQLDLEYVSLRNGRMLLGLAPWTALPESSHLRRGPAELRGVGMEIVIEIDDVYAAERRIVDAGFTVESPARRRPWGTTDLRVIDPDGYYIRLTARR